MRLFVVSLFAMSVLVGCVESDEGTPSAAPEPLKGCPTGEAAAVQAERGDRGYSALDAKEWVVFEWCYYSAGAEGGLTVETREVRVDGNFWAAARGLKDTSLEPNVGCDLVARPPQLFLVAEADEGDRYVTRPPVDGCGSPQAEFLDLLETTGYTVTAKEPVTTD